MEGYVISLPLEFLFHALNFDLYCPSYYDFMNFVSEINYIHFIVNINNSFGLKEPLLLLFKNCVVFIHSISYKLFYI